MTKSKGISERVAELLVQASELYRRGDYRGSINLADNAIELSIRMLLGSKTSQTSDWKGMVQLLDSAVDKKLITNKNLIREIKTLHSLRNTAVHQGEMVSKEEASQYIDRAYQLVGTVPFKEEQAEEQLDMLKADYLLAGSAFEKLVVNTLKRARGKDWKEVLVHPAMSEHALGYRPDAVIVHEDDSLTLVEVYSRISASVIIKLEWYANLVRKEGLDVRDTWLVIPPDQVLAESKILKDLKSHSINVKTILHESLEDAPLTAQR